MDELDHRLRYAEVSAERNLAVEEVRRLREGIEKLIRWAESYRMHHVAIALRNLIGPAEGAEDRGQTDG